MSVTLELHHSGAWHRAATVDPLGDPSLGHKGGCHFTYDDGYALSCLGATDMRAVSAAYPVSLELHSVRPWPAFLLDLLPAGAARGVKIHHLGLRDTDAADWPLLATAGHPPGNIRVAEGVLPMPEAPKGFTYDDIVERKEAFVEYAYQHGVFGSGSSGAQGDAPKFLLVTHAQSGLWCADAAVPDDDAAAHWLVKFPRGKADSDRAVLRNEAAYMRVAQHAGLAVHTPLPTFDRDVLFVARFDRVRTSNGLVRLGQESLASAARISAFGARVSQQRLCETVALTCTEPATELLELLRRDVYNLALGNPDNHPRNTSLSKHLDGRTTLSPLYDFAPMVLDDAGIPRACRWEGMESLSRPDWRAVVTFLDGLGLPQARARGALLKDAETLRRLPLLELGLDAELVTRLRQGIDELVRDLEVLA